MDQARKPPDRSMRASLQVLKSRFKTTHRMVSETRAKLSKIEHGIAQLQGLRRKREVVANLERSDMEQTTAELKAFSLYTHEAADDISKKEEKKRRREPRTPPGKMMPTYGWVEPGAGAFSDLPQLPPRTNVPDHRKGSRRYSGHDRFFDARQEGVVPPVKRKKKKEERESWGSGDTGFVSARQSLEDPFAD